MRCSNLLVLARYSRIEGENGRSGSSVNYLEEGTLRMLLETSSTTPKIGTRFLLENIHATLKGPIFAELNHIVCFIASLDTTSSTGQQSKPNMPHTSSNQIPLLPAKTYVPPSGFRPHHSIQPLIDRPVGDQVMPTDEMIRATATKRRRSSANTKYAFLPLPVMEE